MVLLQYVHNTDAILLGPLLLRYKSLRTPPPKKKITGKKQQRKKWWGCTVTGAKTGERGGDEGEALPVFTLHYDAFQAFEEADHDVCFVDKYRLLHLEDGAEMTWKVEGAEVDREAVMASLSGEDVDLQEVSFVF